MKTNLKQKNETVRKAIKKIMDYYHVPSDLRKSFWNAFNAANRNLRQQSNRG